MSQWLGPAVCEICFRASLCRPRLEKLLNRSGSGCVKSAASWSGLRIDWPLSLALIGRFCREIGVFGARYWRRGRALLNAWFTKVGGGDFVCGLSRKHPGAGWNAMKSAGECELRGGE